MIKRHKSELSSTPIIMSLCKHSGIYCLVLVFLGNFTSFYVLFIFLSFIASWKALEVGDICFTETRSAYVHMDVSIMLILMADSFNLWSGEQSATYQYFPSHRDSFPYIEQYVAVTWCHISSCHSLKHRYLQDCNRRSRCSSFTELNRN